MLRIATVYPELLGTYGDGGNALVLQERARARGVAVSHTLIAHGDSLGEADIYLIGGGEDGPQRLAADALRRGDLGARVANGAFIFAVCAGLQVLGHYFSVAGNDTYDGVGLVDVTTTRHSPRAVGDVLLRRGDQFVVGFENHGGISSRGMGVSPFASVDRGCGNGDGTDGYDSGRILATYAHGPVLAMNPWLADELLGRALQEELSPLRTVADDLHAERVRVLQSRRP
jgi:CobQ-like glutamine amidotransferase family enzyme